MIGVLLVLLRMIVCMAGLVLPFVLLALAERRAEGLLWLMFPIVYGAPALFFLVAVFAPAEACAVAFGLSKTGVVLMAGAGAASLLWLWMESRGASAGKPLVPVLTSRPGLRRLAAWLVTSGVWAGVWRLSEWLVRSVIPHGG